MTQVLVKAHHVKQHYRRKPQPKLARRMERSKLGAAKQQLLREAALLRKAARG